MRFIFPLSAALAVVLALGGCASSIVAPAPEEVQALRAQADELRARGEAIRVKMASEKNRVQRISYLRELEDVGDELRPIEKVLRTVPRDPLAPAAPAPLSAPQRRA